MTQDELKQMNDTFAQFKVVNDTLLAEVKAHGSATSETQVKVDKITNALDSLEAKINARMDTEEKARSTRQDSLEGKLGDIEKIVAKRAPHLTTGTTEEKKAKHAENMRVFTKALTSGVHPTALKSALTVDEFKLFEEKVLQVGNDPAGGYLAPPEYVLEMLMNVVQFSPIRSVARVRTTNRPAIQIPKRTTTATATWTSETGSRPETTNPAFGLEKIDTHELYAMTKVTKQDLEDSAFDLQAFLQNEFAEQFGVTEGVAFIGGTGMGQPEGILTHTGIELVVSGAASTLTPDGLIDLYYSIKEQYLTNATWAMSRSSLKAIRKMKDGDGNYLWAPGIKTDARPATILDRPYITCPDMPSIDTNAKPIIFGDFQRGVIIVDRIEMEMMMDPFTSKSTGMIEFSARKRVGAQVVISEALKIQKCST